jgi:ATP/ADP translocase
MLNRLLYLRDGELARLLPFFGLYLLLFGAFSLADGLAFALFVQRVGAAGLPTVYGIVAAANFAAMALYLWLAESLGSTRTFVALLCGTALVFGVAWIFLHSAGSHLAWYYLLYVARDLTFTLMLMHFGTFLQDYFTRNEMNRVLPLIYSGGRVGGIAGGFTLAQLAEPWGLLNLLGLFTLLCLFGIAATLAIAWRYPHAPPETSPNGHLSDDAHDPEVAARRSYLGFLRYVWLSPLLFWTTATTLLFMVCRWFLHYQYSQFFGSYFANARAMAEFMGEYTQYALFGSMIVQVLVVNRMIAWIGLKGAMLVYAVLLLIGMLACVGEMTFTLAVFSRVVESELRFGLRNPIMQLITNQFSKSLRLRVRAWSFGMLIPFATLISSGMLQGLSGFDHPALWVAWVGGACGLAYFLASLGLLSSFHEEPEIPPSNS